MRACVLGLGFDGLTLAVSGLEEADAAWLEEFLLPWFEPAAPSPSDCEVAVVADGAAYERRCDAGPRQDGATEHAFSLDSGAVRLPLWRSPEGERVVFDRRLRVFYVAPGPARIEIVAAPETSRIRLAVMRVIRELAQERARATGCLLVHAAALTLDGAAFLIAGPKGAGKTSLLVACLQGATARFLANDRVVVRFTAGGPIARGMPTIVSVRRPTLEAHPLFRRRLESSRYDCALTLEEAREPRERRTNHDGSVDLSPVQFCSLLDAEACAANPIRALLFPRSYSPAHGIRIAALDAPRTAEHLAQSLLGGAAESGEINFFSRALPPQQPAVAPALWTDDLASRAPGFEVRRADPGATGAAAEVLRGLAG